MSPTYIKMDIKKDITKLSKGNPRSRGSPKLRKVEYKYADDKNKETSPYLKELHRTSNIG